MTKKNCVAEGCEKSAYQRNRCWHHYRLLRIATEPDFLEKEAAKSRRNRENNPDLYRKISEKGYLRHYGLTHEMYDKMVQDCMNLCNICQKPPVGIKRKGVVLPAKLCIDHCHVTGVVRGLLCNKCNSAIGYLFDSTTSMDNAIQYLVKNGSAPPEELEPF